MTGTPRGPVRAADYFALLLLALVAVAAGLLLAAYADVTSQPPHRDVVATVDLTDRVEEPVGHAGLLTGR